MLENFHLKVFRAVALHLSFRKAGEMLYLTQPAVTLQIKTLEEQLGTKLFERSASGVRLNQAGETLLKFANQMHDIAGKAENELAALKGEAAGELVLGASTTIAQYVLPIMLAEFSRRYPAVQLQVFSENTEHVADGVASGRFGLGLIEGPPLRRDLKLERWFDDELLLVVPSSHEWAELGNVPPQMLLGVPLIMRARGSGSRHVAEQDLQKAGIRLGALRVAMELDSTEAILSCVEAGLGVGFVSEWAIMRRASVGGIAILRLQGTAMKRSFSFVMQQGPALQHAAETMLRFLKSRVPVASPAVLKCTTTPGRGRKP